MSLDITAADSENVKIEKLLTKINQILESETVEEFIVVAKVKPGSDEGVCDKILCGSSSTSEVITLGLLESAKFMLRGAPKKV